MADTTQFSGVHTALITPFFNGALAIDDLNSLVERQIDEGIDGLVAVGTTGESPTLSHAEHHAVMSAVATASAGRVPVLAGTGSNSTVEAVSLTEEADKIENVTGVLVVAPYYNKPSQEGLFRHFSAIASATRKPVILYSIPGRCVIDISVEICARLYEAHPHVCGIKEAGGSTDRVAALRNKLGNDFLILSGDDSMTLPFMSYGATGVISVASNLIVTELVQYVRLALGNDFLSANEIALKYYDLFNLLFIEPNPVPVKTAMARAGIIRSAEVRLPLCEMSEAKKALLLAELERLGL